MTDVVVEQCQNRVDTEIGKTAVGHLYISTVKTGSVKTKFFIEKVVFNFEKTFNLIPDGGKNKLAQMQDIP